MTSCRGGQPTRIRALRNWIVWWFLLFGIWLAYVGVFATTENAVGAAAAAVAASAAELVRSLGLMRFAPDLRWAVRAARVPFDALVQFGTVTRVLGAAALRRRAPHGGFKTVPFHTRGPAARAAGSRALAAWATTISPNDYVLEVGEEAALKHALDPHRAPDRML